MSRWLDVARIAAGVNVVLLLGLGNVWLRNYRRHGASHTLGLLVVGGFLLLENLLWVGLYVFHDGFVGWFVATTPDVQIGMTLLCGLELIALVVLARLTWT
ncbi:MULTISPECIES: hypothetical protein [Halolamina]|uniref:Uncharacterized protein n=1 Tax=Halolamina pelagica TaxID=699431 RepID=A0A1I5SZZ4_9EURY|nr:MULTISPECIES: hypothetical protein [Halolamina]NHX36927.1 hypothetical protein [Halolamina sp. R1-12]SFP76007.1 hypothetical protein SAMN05216277_10783 [Halolamina pelagica]